MFLHYPEKHKSQNGSFSHAVYCLENDTALACYIFDTHQPILIIFVDNKVVLVDTVCKYYFSPGHFCVTHVRQQDLRHLLLLERQATCPVTRSFCYNL